MSKSLLLSSSATNINLGMTGGTIACVKNEKDQLVPVSGQEFAKNAGLDPLKFRVRGTEIYVIDSLVFNVAEHGEQIIRYLDETAGDGNPLVITTGTDTIKWLSALIGNHERDRGLQDRRKIVLLSSMHAPVDEMGKAHVNNVVRMGFELAATRGDLLRHGVYVASADNDEATEVKFFNLSDPDSRLGKIPLNESAVIKGNNGVTLKMIEGKIVLVSDEKESRADAIKMAALEEEAFKHFINGCIFRRLPVLAGSEDRAVQKYFHGLGKGDVVALEVAQSWFGDDGEITEQKKSFMTDLIASGIKIILNNRSFYNSKSDKFEANLSDEQFAKLKISFAESPQVCPIGHISTNAAYMRLARLDVGSPRQSEDSKLEDGMLGILYVPSLPLFAAGFSAVRENMPRHVIVEFLTNGVVPETVAGFVEKKEGQIIEAAGTYDNSSLSQSPYAAAGDMRSLEERRNIFTRGGSADSLIEKYCISNGSQHSPSPSSTPLGTLPLVTHALSAEVSPH